MEDSKPLWLYANTKLKVTFTVCGILLDIPFARNPNLLMINYVLLLGDVVHYQKFKKINPLYSKIFLAQVKSKLVFRDFYSANGRNNRFNEPYKRLFNMLA